MMISFIIRSTTCEHIIYCSQNLRSLIISNFPSNGVPFNILNDIFNDYPFSSISASRDAGGKLRGAGASRRRRALLELDEPTPVETEDDEVDDLKKNLAPDPGT